MNINYFPIGAVSLTMCLLLVVNTATAQSVPPVQNASVSVFEDVAHVLARGPAGAEITHADVLTELQRAPLNVRQSVAKKPEALQQLVSNLMVRRLLARDALRDSLDKDPLVQASVAIASDRALSDAQLKRLDMQNEPSAAALDSYARQAYKAGGDQFNVPAQTRASHILLPDTGPESAQKAKDLLAVVRAGASFEELAKAQSIDAASAAKGGNLGFFSAGKMVRPFEDAVNALVNPGDLSEPVKTQFGYHIIRLDERKAESRLTFNEVKPQLLAEARTAILNQARAEMVGSLIKGITFDSAALEAMAKAAKP